MNGKLTDLIAGAVRDGYQRLDDILTGCEVKRGLDFYPVKADPHLHRLIVLTAFAESPDKDQIVESLDTGLERLILGSLTGVTALDDLLDSLAEYMATEINDVFEEVAAAQPGFISDHREHQQADNLSRVRDARAV